MKIGNDIHVLLSLLITCLFNAIILIRLALYNFLFRLRNSDILRYLALAFRSIKRKRPDGSDSSQFRFSRGKITVDKNESKANDFARGATGCSVYLFSVAPRAARSVAMRKKFSSLDKL